MLRHVSLREHVLEFKVTQGQRSSRANKKIQATCPRWRTTLHLHKFVWIVNLYWLTLFQLINKSIADNTSYTYAVKYEICSNIYNLQQETQIWQCLDARFNSHINTDICTMFVLVLSLSLTACVSISNVWYIADMKRWITPSAHFLLLPNLYTRWPCL